jgi:hypothetical protein
MGEAASQCADVAFSDHGRGVGRWDSFVHKGRRKGGVVRHLRLSCEQVAAALESQIPCQRHCRAQTRSWDG